VTESKSGRRAILAKRVIDCTGDADVAFLAGARCRQTEVGENMGVTSVFSAVGVERDRFLEHTQKNLKTYEDWSKREGSWQQWTKGKEDTLSRKMGGVKAEPTVMRWVHLEGGEHISEALNTTVSPPENGVQFCVFIFHTYQ